MTAEQLITELGKRGVEVSRRSLFDYQKIDPGEAPKGFNDVNAWAAFILKHQVYEAGRTQSPEQREAKERAASDRNGRESSTNNQNGEHAEFSAGEERKQRILRLRLINAAKRVALERLRESTVGMDECLQAMARIRSLVNGEILKLPASLCDQLTGRNPEQIQRVLDVALRGSLAKLSQAEAYL
jgi:hypothetical protein